MLESTATVVVLFTDDDTISALFDELSKNSTREFVWIFSTSSQMIHNKFHKTKGIYIFQPHVDHAKEFDDYLSQLTPRTNIRNPYFHNSTYNHIYYKIFCEVHVVEYEVSGSEGTISYDTYECPNNWTTEPDYAQGEMVPFVIDAVYAYAYALQNFIDNNCDKPLRWDRVTRQCDGMKNTLTGENFLEYLYNITFNGICYHNVSFDKNGDPTGGFEISSSITHESGGQY